ncbi:MAG: sortase domain-containing protein [Candidatus Saccharimonadales bacterium]
MAGPSKYKKFRFYLSVSATYALTLLFAGYLLTGTSMMHKQPYYVKYSPRKPVAFSNSVKITSGKPIRIVLPKFGIDLPVDTGLYDQANQSWTLSGYHAQYAVTSIEPNDYEGNTFIYGHNNPYVFGKLKTLAPGDTMQLYTDNGLVFKYAYQDFNDTQPNDNSVFRYYGPPTATVQTCSGAFNELRRMYHFNFLEVNHV